MGAYPERAEQVKAGPRRKPSAAVTQAEPAPGEAADWGAMNLDELLAPWGE